MYMNKILAISAAALISTAAFAQDELPTVYMVGNAHLDTQWRWDLQQVTREFLPNTLKQNFALFEEYPDYIFNFEGADKYLWMKEYYPEDYAKLKEYVAAGRWHIAGSSWDANDHNLPSIEACIRNYLYGQKFYEEEFGVKGTEVMLPDCFGFGIVIPSVAAHCGLIGFHTQKLQWRSKPFYGERKMPFNFGIWEGLDGSRIMAELDPGDYSWDPANEDVSNNVDFKKKLADNQAHGLNCAMRYFGTRSSRYHGDQGGSPTRFAMNNIEKARLNPKDYRLEYATVDKMFKDYYMKEGLPVFKGELLMDVHATGCYTSHSEMKKINRRNEWALVSTEQAAALGEMMGAMEYPTYTLNEAWKRVLVHQFHDDLTGTSLPKAYVNSYNDEYATYSQLNKTLEREVLAISTALDTKVKGTPIIVYNSVTAEVGDYAKVEVELPLEAKSASVYDPFGKPVHTQILSRNEGKALVAFAIKAPSASLGVYDLRVSKSSSSKALKASEKGIENSIYKVSFDENGDICSIIDKRCGRELVEQGQALSLSIFRNNISSNWPAWEILKGVMDGESLKVRDNVKISVEECGALRAVVKIERTLGASTFIQRIILTDGASDDRIDIECDFDWQEKESLLKASFPLSVSNPNATYDLGMGSIERGNNTDIQYEVFSHQWTDLSSTDGSYGVSILNDGKYGWDKPNDNTLRLTLLHTPGMSERTYDQYQRTMDLGRHSFTYSIIGHEGPLNTAAADIAGDALNCPALALVGTKHTGKARSLSLVSSSNPYLRVKAFKKAYDGDGYVVRVYELSGKGAEGELNFFGNILSAELVNGIEEEPTSTSFSGKKLPLSSNGFALMTYRVRFEEPILQASKEEYTTLELPYNEMAITSNAFSACGHMSDDWQSYAAEIIPETLTFAGIPFEIAHQDQWNALRCKGQSLALPQGTKTVYLLAASHEGDVNAIFDAGIPTNVEVDNFRDNYGVYGWQGFYDSVHKNGTVAYIGDHRHDSRSRDLYAEPSYMFLVEVPVAQGASELKLPDDTRVTILSAVAGK